MAGLWQTRNAVESDYEQWRELYHGYREFYRQERSEEVRNTKHTHTHTNMMPYQLLVTADSSVDFSVEQPLARDRSTKSNHRGFVFNL